MRLRLLGSVAAVLTAAVVAAAQPGSLPQGNRTFTLAQGEGKAAQPPTSPPPRPVTPPAEPKRPADVPPPLFMPQDAPVFAPPASPGGCATGCDSGCGACDESKAAAHHLGPWNKVWVRAGYAILFTRRPSLPATVVVAGSQSAIDSSAGYGSFSGLFAEGGMWLNERHTYGIGASGFLTEKRSSVIGRAASDAGGSPGLTRPFFNPTVVGGGDALVVSAPGRFAGSVAVETGSRLAGAEVYGLLNILNTTSWTANVLVGFRYFDLDEYLTIYQATAGLNGATIPVFGNTAGVGGVNITDRVRTRNQFFGGQFGVDGEYRLGPASFGLGSNLGFGPVHQVTQIDGQTAIAGGASGPGGFLAVGDQRGGNIGRSTTDNFALLLDVHSTVGVQVTNRVRVAARYNFLYLNNVARPGDQLDTVVDPRLIPTAPQFGARIPAAGAVPPRVPIERTDFIVHGVRLMVSFQY